MAVSLAEKMTYSHFAISEIGFVCHKKHIKYQSENIKNAESRPALGGMAIQIDPSASLSPPGDFAALRMTKCLCYTQAGSRSYRVFYLGLFGFVFGLWRAKGAFIIAWHQRGYRVFGGFEFGFVLHFDVHIKDQIVNIKDEESAVGRCFF